MALTDVQQAVLTAVGAGLIVAAIALPIDPATRITVASAGAALLTGKELAGSKVVVAQPVLPVVLYEKQADGSFIPVKSGTTSTA